MKRRPVWPAACLALLLGGCSLAPPLPPAPRQSLAATATTVQRRISLIPDDTRRAPRTLLAVLRVRGAGWRAAFLTPYGQRLVTLIHEDGDSRYREGDVPLATLGDTLPPADWLAARLDWCLWPVAALQAAFDGTPWTVDVADGARIIRHHGRTVARITPADAEFARAETVRLDDRRGGYRLRISPLPETSHE
ncbi:MAG: hypothetical protein AWU55_1517 [Halomonadaceae bacterium T82-2]|nr:MAG: hypothetical protein AWU55_1517 [Halomonadaceae bacterium T82-2]